MPVYIALLRGINVGGNRMISMATLREACEEIGWKDVVTYLQSGNVIFYTSVMDAGALESTFTRLIKSKFGHDVPVCIRNQQEWLKMMERIPFHRPQQEYAHVTFLSGKPDMKRLPPSGKQLEDQYQVSGREIFVLAKAGYSNSKFGNLFFEKALLANATTRNWKTVLAIYEMIVKRK